MTLELRLLRSFVVLAEELNFSRSAERLLISQPALTQQIKRLELNMGALLFERNRTHVHLTPAGELMLQGSRDLLESAATLHREVRQEAGVEDTLRLGYVEASNLPFIAPTLQRLRVHFPNVRIERLELYPAQQIEALERRQIDVGFATLPVKRRGIDVLPLMTTVWSVALPLEHPLAALAEVPLMALRGERLITVPPIINPGLSTWLSHRCRALGFDPEISFETASTTSALQLLRAGLGLPVMCSGTALPIDIDTVIRPLQDDQATMQVGAIWRSDSRSALIRSLISSLSPVLSSNSLPALPAI